MRGIAAQLADSLCRWDLRSMSRSADALVSCSASAPAAGEL